MDMDGFVSGSEIKDVFLQSGLPQGVLAHIWWGSDLFLSFNPQYTSVQWARFDSKIVLYETCARKIYYNFCYRQR